MKKKLRNSVNRANGIVGHLAAEKKKTVLAVCLITLMAFMWIKVFIGKKPASASANPTVSQVTDNQADSDKMVIFMDLPVVEGRNDVITKDFFNANGWKNFTDKNKVVLKQEVKVVSGDRSEKVIRKIAENIKLEAFLMGDNPRAYINDKVMSVGDILSVNEANDIYEFEVMMIENSSVILRCGKAEVTLKLKQVIEESN